MAWWNFWSKKSEWEKVIAEAESDKSIDFTEFNDAISEPVKSITMAIISDRKRFIIELDRKLFKTGPTTYEILDMDTDECFVVSYSTDYDIHGFDMHFSGIPWAKQHEIKWAFDKISLHYFALNARARRINAIRERNRLIEIYA